jgi:hypothetical protein
MGWRTNLLNIVFADYNNFSNEELLEMDAYQFGVLGGDSMVELASLLKKNRIELNSFNGFDVFTGMPKETEEPIFQDSWDPDIEPDAFNALKRLNLSNSKECADYVKNNVEQTFEKYKSNTKVNIFPGLVEETLKKNIKTSKFKKAFYVDFDLDIYSPTKYAFKFLVENNFIVPGTIIGYDDWGGTPGFENYENGESRAHKEIVDEYGIIMTKIFQIGDSFPHVQNVWVVDEVKK